jgi:hypothetical protein
MHRLRRQFRWAATGLGTFAFLAAAATAAAATSTSWDFNNSSSQPNSEVFVFSSASSGNPFSGPPYRLRVFRNNAQIGDSGDVNGFGPPPGFGGGGQFGARARISGALLPGDVAKVYSKKTAATDPSVDQQVNDGMPTINGDACAGRPQFTGSGNAGTTIRAAGAFAPSPAGSRSGGSGNNPGTVTQSGNTFSVALRWLLVNGDLAFADADRSAPGRTVSFEQVRQVGTCGSTAGTAAAGTGGVQGTQGASLTGGSTPLPVDLKLKATRTGKSRHDTTITITGVLPEQEIITALATFGHGKAQPGTARVRVFGRSSTTAGPGPFKLTIPPSKAAKAALRSRGHLPVSVHLAFRSTARLGASTSTKDLKLKVSARKKKH